MFQVLFKNPPQQKQMPAEPLKTLKEQARALLQDLEELHEGQELQEPPRLPPEDQQELLRIIKELQEELREILRPGTCWPGLDWTEEIDLWELRGFPTLLLKKLWKLLAHQKTCLHKGDHPSPSLVANPVSMGGVAPLILSRTWNSRATISLSWP